MRQFNGFTFQFFHELQDDIKSLDKSIENVKEDISEVEKLHLALEDKVSDGLKEMEELWRNFTWHAQPWTQVRKVDK